MGEFLVGDSVELVQQVVDGLGSAASPGDRGVVRFAFEDGTFQVDFSVSWMPQPLPQTVHPGHIAKVVDGG